MPGRPAGALYIDATGYPQLDASNNYVVGDPNPDWTGSVRTALRFKGFSVDRLLDIRHGGQNYNGTRGAMDHFGTSLRVAAASATVATSSSARPT